MSFFLSLSFLAGDTTEGEDSLRFLETFTPAGDFFLSAPSCRRLSLSGVPDLAMAARERIMSVWAAMLMLFSLPASLAGLQSGTSGVFGGNRCLGVPSPPPSLALLWREGVLRQSVVAVAVAAAAASGPSSPG